MSPYTEANVSFPGHYITEREKSQDTGKVLPGLEKITQREEQNVD